MTTPWRLAFIVLASSDRRTGRCKVRMHRHRVRVRRDRTVTSPRLASGLGRIAQSPSMPVAVGSRIGRYEITGLLGQGAMGEVYRAFDERLGRDVAVKVLPASFSADAERLRRFDQEARAAGALNHPNVLAIFDIGAHEEAPYIVSELLEGGTLRARLGNGPPPLRKVVEFGIQ